MSVLLSLFSSDFFQIKARIHLFKKRGNKTINKQDFKYKVDYYTLVDQERFHPKKRPKTLWLYYFYDDTYCYSSRDYCLSGYRLRMDVQNSF